MKNSATQYPLAAHPSSFMPYQKNSGVFVPDTRALRNEGAKSAISMLTLNLLHTYRTANPQLQYKPAKVSRRVLTNPRIPRHNEGRDNENYDLILTVGDFLYSDPDPTGTSGWRTGTRYTVLDVLGQGTFGQVVKCRSEDGSLVAVKVLKNKAAYFKQGMYEIAILTILNQYVDPNGSRHTLRLYDHFLFHNHLCIVNELLSINLFELIKQNNFRGITIRLIQKFISQLLDALIGLEEYDIIHCDLKPENILLESLNSTKIRLIDFGSACMEHSPQYSYIQSRHYRAPEVLLGLQYTTAIDMWSVGCITAELLLGIPLFPGANAYNQMFKISEMMGGLPPPRYIEKGSRAPTMFKKGPIVEGQQTFQFKSELEYQRDNSVRIDPDKRYFVYRTLSEIVKKVPIKTHKSQEYDLQLRESFEHFLRGLLNLDPSKRWSARIARKHPFLCEGKESLVSHLPFPSAEILAEVDRARHYVPPRSRLPPMPFQKTVSRDSLFPPSVVRSNGTIDTIRAYALFVNSLRLGRIVDIANDKAICPVLESKLLAKRKEEEMEQEHERDNESMDIEKQNQNQNQNHSEIFMNSFSQNYLILPPAGFPTQPGAYVPTFAKPQTQNGPTNANLNTNSFGTSVGGGLAFGNGLSNSNNYTNANHANPPSIQLGQSVNDGGLILSPLGPQGTETVFAPSAYNIR